MIDQKYGYCVLPRNLYMTRACAYLMHYFVTSFYDAIMSLLYEVDMPIVFPCCLLTFCLYYLT